MMRHMDMLPFHVRMHTPNVVEVIDYLHMSPSLQHIFGL